MSTSTTLNLADCILVKARRYQSVGRPCDALRLLERLARLRGLSPAVAEETQARLAEIQLSRAKYDRSRRHLTAALLHKPDNARYHFLMGKALSEDTSGGDNRRAAAHFQRSLAIDPDQPECLCERGMQAIREGQIEEGLSCLKRAADLAPNDPEVIRRLANGLAQSGQPEAARQALLAARFRNPRDARFELLWRQYRFQTTQQNQSSHDGTEEEDADEPVLLPFAKRSEWPLRHAGRIRRNVSSKHFVNRLRTSAGRGPETWRTAL